MPKNSVSESNFLGPLENECGGVDSLIRIQFECPISTMNKLYCSHDFHSFSYTVQNYTAYTPCIIAHSIGCNFLSDYVVNIHYSLPVNRLFCQLISVIFISTHRPRHHKYDVHCSLGSKGLEKLIYLFIYFFSVPYLLCQSQPQ